jgi:hypothetical protein
MARKKDDSKGTSEQLTPLISSREDILTLARGGLLTPKEAEAEAAARGWGRFAVEPPLPAFDPMNVSRWSLAMSLAWIAWRDIELVRDMQPEFRSQCTHWVFQESRVPVEATEEGARFQEFRGWVVEQKRPATISLLKFFAADAQDDDAPKAMPFYEAETSLWQALADGVVTGVAIDGSGKPTDVPEREWPYLKIYEEKNRDVLKYEALGPVIFEQVKLKRVELLKTWPRPTSTIKAESDCHSWLVDQIRSSPVSKPRSRESYWIAAKGKFPTLAKRQFMRTWQNAIAKTGAHGWSAPGRPKSNRSGK